MKKQATDGLVNGPTVRETDKKCVVASKNYLGIFFGGGKKSFKAVQLEGTFYSQSKLPWKENEL